MSFLKNNLILLSVLVISLALIGCGGKPDTTYDGVYKAYETTEVLSPKELTDGVPEKKIDTKPFKITLKEGEAEVYNLEKKEVIIKGSFSVKAGTKQNNLNQSMEINIKVPGKVFRPTINFIKGELFYLDKDDEPHTLTIFKKE